MFRKQTPHDLHLYGNIQFIEVRFLFVERDDFQHMIPKSHMPVFAVINMDGTYSEILYDRIDIFGTDSTLKESIDQLRIKCDRYIGTILFVLHFSGMQSIGIAEDDVAFFQMKGEIVYPIMHGSFFYICDLNLRMAVPHKGIGIIF